jgi:hypothetical protein
MDAVCSHSAILHTIDYVTPQRRARRHALTRGLRCTASRMFSSSTDSRSGSHSLCSLILGSEPVSRSEFNVLWIVLRFGILRLVYSLQYSTEAEVALPSHTPEMNISAYASVENVCAIVTQHSHFRLSLSYRVDAFLLTWHERIISIVYSATPVSISAVCEPLPTLCTKRSFSTMWPEMCAWLRAPSQHLVTYSKWKT